MIGELGNGIREKWRVFWRKSVSLLAAPVQACKFCEKSVGQASNALGLCGPCYRSIPWIKEVLCPVCGRYEVCHDCKRRKDAAFQFSRSAVRYDDGMKMWLAQYKYRGDERLAELLARMLLHGYHKLMQTEELKDSVFDLITFVPLNEERLMDRGFNQAERLARLVGEMKGVPVVPLLTRVRNTSKQSFKSRSERLEDMKGVFQVESVVLSRIHFRERPLRILIIDDVYTTGSTLQQCALAIAGRMEAKVYGLSWAR